MVQGTVVRTYEVTLILTPALAPTGFAQFFKRWQMLKSCVNLAVANDDLFHSLLLLR
jgi:hypothetical protein